MDCEKKLLLAKINNFRMVKMRRIQLEMHQGNNYHTIKMIKYDAKDEIDEEYSKVIFETEYEDDIIQFLKGMIEMYYVLR